jgi:uncharacterized membrane protein YqiK
VLLAHDEINIVWIGIVLAAMAIPFFLAVSFIKTCYKRCPSNRLLVVYGKTPQGGAAKVIHGGAVMVIPIIQDYAYLSLEPLSGELQLSDVSLVESRSASLNGKWTVAISPEPELAQAAATHLLGFTNELMQTRVREMLEAAAVTSLREAAVDGSVSPAKVEHLLQDAAGERLATIGIQIHALSVQRIVVK